MTLVIDASALVEVLAERDADGLWAKALIAGESLAAPAILPAETSNILRHLERTGVLSGPQAADAQRGMVRRIALFPFEPFAERVWELRHNLNSYDAWYVALAEALGCPLVTIDYRLVRSPGTACAFLTPPGDG